MVFERNWYKIFTQTIYFKHCHVTHVQHVAGIRKSAHKFELHCYANGGGPMALPRMLS